MTTDSKRRGEPAQNALLISVRQLAQVAGIPELTYRRNLLNAPGHPAPIANGRPLLYRRAEVLAWLESA